MRLPVVLLVLVYSSVAAGPALAGDGRFWPTKERWRDAFRSAVRDAAISDWAVRETPVFGSTANALQWSDDLRTVTHLGMLATLFLVDEPDRPWRAGTKRFIVQHVSAVAAGTAWARVEAGKHYPTDVLAGAALGNFVSILINDTFLEMNPNVTVNLDLGGDEPRFMVSVRW